MEEKHIFKHKNTKLIVLFLIVLSLLSAISCVSAADCDSNATELIGDVASCEIHVSLDGSDDGNGSLQNPFKSIECAVNNSEGDSTIYLNDGEYVGANNRNITIDKSITIIGKSKENTIINGDSSAILFNVTGRLTLINVTLLNGYSTENGGSIYCDGGAINIKNCILKNSTAEANGGAIYNNLGVLNIEDSLFINNSASDYGGVLYTLGVTSIKDSTFTENILTSQWGVGGCIAAGGKIDLDGCLFYKCFTTYSAAAILNLGNATVNNCRFENLSTDYTAAGISNHKYMLINNSYFGYNDVKYYAAALLAPPSGQHVVTEVYNSVFEYNHAGYHGAVSNNFKDTELYMQNCAIVGNYLKLNEAYGDFSLDENITVQYCWWGSNKINPYYYSPHSGDRHPENINASRWLVMTFTSNDDAIYRNEINQLTVSLKHYFDNETKEINDYDGEFDLPLDVTIYTDSGIVATKKLVNGVATFDFKAQSDISAIYAKIDNQILKIDNFKLRKTQIIANDFEKYYGSSSKLVVKIVKDNNVPLSNEKVTVTLGKSTYTAKTDKNGIAKLTIKNPPKTYTAKITYKGSKYVGSSKSIKVKIVKPTITASKLKIRKNGKFVVTFKDANKKAIKNVQVQFKIKGKTYVQTTNSKGQAKITVNAKPGKYTVKVGFKNTNYYGTTSLSKRITVVK